MRKILLCLPLLATQVTAMIYNDDAAKERATTLTSEEICSMNYKAEKFTVNRGENRHVLAWAAYIASDNVLPEQRGEFMRTFADHLLREEDYAHAGIWFYRAAIDGDEHAQRVFVDKSILFKTQTEEICAQKFECYWRHFSVTTISPKIQGEKRMREHRELSPFDLEGDEKVAPVKIEINGIKRRRKLF